MDGRQFDDLARNVGRSVTRKAVIKLLAGLSASGLTSLVGVGGSEAKRRNFRDKKTCQQENKDAVCHCPPAQGGTHCRILCVEGTGHDDHPYDCICFNNDPSQPRPLPPCAQCPANPKQLDSCAPNLICGGACKSTTPRCPNLPGCVCNASTLQCGAPDPCSGPCRDKPSVQPPIAPATGCKDRSSAPVAPHLPASAPARTAMIVWPCRTVSAGRRDGEAGVGAR
jgi:hypothetical protein